MRLQIDDVALFTRIAELGSLSAAARERDIPVSQVTRSLSRLEAVCEVRLLHRSTHGLSLTDEGDTFLAYGRRLLDTTSELGSELSGKISGPSGWVRISVSPVLAQAVIAPSLNGLYQLHPQLHIDIQADDRMADMAREGIDIAIRASMPHNDNLVARRIGGYSRSLYASPGYLKLKGIPTQLADLQQHRLLTNSASPTLNRWPMADSGKLRTSKDFWAEGHTKTDNSAVMLALAQHGAGIARLMDLLARPLVNSGGLTPILQDCFSSPCSPIYAMMLQERHRLPKIRACIDYWAHWIAGMAQVPPPVLAP